MKPEDYERVLNEGFAENLEKYFGRKKEGVLEEMIKKEER